MTSSVLSRSFSRLPIASGICFASVISVLSIRRISPDAKLSVAVIDCEDSPAAASRIELLPETCTIQYGMDVRLRLAILFRVPLLDSAKAKANATPTALVLGLESCFPYTKSNAICRTILNTYTMSCIHSPDQLCLFSRSRV